ncbi:HAMP domain-containing protein [Rhodobacteraceae bacterium 2CG4]|uniref:histidine kinase n=2 Tax=Halovulum marinum TaxID=2662447 RepID=A0A6L5YZ49_9RHOB|nr:HAMP domain-containing protein [Halovulum marinum]
MVPSAPAVRASSGGLRRRLLLAFVGLSALVVIAAAIAVLSLWLNRESHDRISNQSIPIATTALDLTRIAQEIVETVPELVAARDVAAQTALTSALSTRVEELAALLDQMRTYDIESRSAASIERSASLFAANIEAINRMVSGRIAVETELDRQSAAGQAAVADILGLLDSYTEDRGEGLARVLEADSSIISQRLRLLRARSEAREIGLLFGTIADRGAGEATALVRSALEDIRAVIDDVRPADRDRLSERIAVLDEVFMGGNSLARQSAFQEQLAAAAAQALGENADLADRFGSAVDRMIAEAKADVAEANSRAADIQRTAFWLLLSVVIATLLSSYLIVRFYVHKNILARLTALTDSMMAIAGGNLSAEIPEPSRDELGSMATALNVFRDTAIEFRDSNLREIRETRSRLHHAIENIQEGFALFDGEDRLTLANARFPGLLLGEGASLGVGTRFDALLRRMKEAGVVRDPDGSWLDAAKANHHTPEGTQVWELADDRWVGLAERRTDDGGRVVMVTDLTAIKRHEIELDGLVAQLQKASAAKSSFIANVSHELRTPLTAVLGFAQIVQSRLESVIFPAVSGDAHKTDRAMGQIRENMGIMIQEGQRLTKMINDILDLEKIEAGKMVWQIEALDMGSVIRQAAAATNSLYVSKGLAFHIDVAEDLPPVMGDRDRLVQVVINLISNAVKFTVRGHVACTARRGAGPFVQVSVIDTGIGIAPEDQDEVFDKFRQVGDTLTEKPSGTGLGLPICREIVEHLNGTITVESMPGYGSTFTFQLPVAEAGA